MKHGLLKISILLTLLSAGPSWAETETADPTPKTDGTAARLLLPFYLVDTTNASGTTTLFAVRNEGAATVNLQFSYFEVGTPQIPQDLPAANTDITLAPRQVKTVNIRDVPVAVDNDGFARGFVVVESTDPGVLLQGDYFQVTPGDGFATGDRLLNIDPGSQDNDLCRRVHSRYLNGQIPFDSGTQFFVWINTDRAPDPSETLITYSVYDEAGNTFVEGVDLPVGTVAFLVSASSLITIGPLIGPEFGVIEFNFGTTEGYVTAVMSASNLYSVGIEAVCLDNAPS